MAVHTQRRSVPKRKAKDDALRALARSTKILYGRSADDGREPAAGSAWSPSNAPDISDGGSESAAGWHTSAGPRRRAKQGTLSAIREPVSTQHAQGADAAAEEAPPSEAGPSTPAQPAGHAPEGIAGPAAQPFHAAKRRQILKDNVAYATPSSFAAKMKTDAAKREKRVSSDGWLTCYYSNPCHDMHGKPLEESHARFVARRA
ncbi:hypothetical protein WJX72_003949 [[Myrmecia] bisecta]|uniref:Uncharacterized protein n=1 Tax=[Myrmecia] bisecta TaxID=41462 RepID=A0AAW1PG99_9CHLO